MKYFTVIILGLLAIGSFAIKSDDCNNDVNRSLIVDGYNAGSRTYPLPKYRYGQSAVYKFIESFIEICVDGAKQLENIIYGIIEEKVRNLIRNVEISRDNLRRAISTMKNNNPYCLENPLKSLKNQSDIFLALIPGNALIKRRGLPELPAQQIRTKNLTKELTLDVPFLHLDQFIEEYFTNAYSLLNGVYTSGWSASRLNYNTLQSQYRNKYLNGRLLNIYADITKEFLGKSHLIQSHVKNETWTGFKAVADRIQSIYKDWKKSMNDKNCPELL